MTRRVLVVLPHHSSFIDQDIKILEKDFPVETFEYTRAGDRAHLLRALPRSRVGIAWFVLGYAYLMVRACRLTRTNILLIPGGWDVESISELEYGEMRWPTRRDRTAYALARAQRVLAVSSFTLGHVRRLAPKARADVLYHGFDDRKFPMGSRARDGVITVARIAPGTWKLKGLHVLVSAARRMPDVPFVIVGDFSQAGPLLQDLPGNVSITGPMTPSQLARAFQAARVYAQLSAVESFGCALAEAMLTGCVPVVTDRGALPEVVGDMADPIPYEDEGATERALRKALERSDGPSCRERILTHFPLRQRAVSLRSEVRALLDGQT